jgi:FkbM family methyltransferase
MTDVRSLAGLARSLAIYYGRPWRIAQMGRFYAGFVRPGDLAFDIGAHVGNRSRALAHAGARVVALEPQELFHGFLRRTLPSTITVLPLAAGSTVSSAVMSVSRLHPTVSTTTADFVHSVAASKSFSSVSWDRSQPVQTTTLDILIERYGEPAFVKIDVEGAEAEVLAGLSRPVGALAFEFLPATRGVTQACVEHLGRLGDYRYNLTRGERLTFELREWVAAEEIGRFLSRLDRDERSGDIYARRL